MATRGRKIQGDHKLTQTELNRRFQDNAASIDTQLEEAWANVDWDRRNAAERGGIVEWTKTYMLGLTLDEAPPPLGEEILKQMEHAVTAHSNYAIAMGRGAGKSAYSVTTAIYALTLGIQKFLVIITANARASTGILNDIWRVFQVPDSAFAQDYPEIVLPFTIANGSFRRRQLFQGQLTEISKTANQLILATYHDERFKRASGSLIITRSITGGIRGIRRFTMRPDCCLIDDIQSTTSAQNPEQVEKMLDTIRKDIIPLAGKERISLLQTFTQICPDDLVERIKNDKSWITTIYPTIIHYPDNMKLWDSYLAMYEDEIANESDHSQSLQFYRDHYDEMNAGSQVFNPKRFSEKDGHISAIQKWMQLRREIGEAAFDAEYQQAPKKLEYKLDVTPKDVLLKVVDTPWLTIPEGHVLTVASTDLNVSHYLTTCILSFRPDGTSHVVWHDIQQCRIPTTLPQAEYNQKVFAELDKLQDRLLGLNIKLDCHAIDGGGQNFDPVTQFCRTTKKIPSCAFLGRASHIFNPYVRSKLRDAVGNTVLCGDAQAHAGNSLGIKYVFWDSDRYKVVVHKAILAPAGSVGALTIFNADSKIHAEFSLQMCNEKLMSIQHKPDGRDVYVFKTREPHDFLDCCAQAYAACAQNNILGTGLTAKTITPSKAQLLAKLIRERRKTQFR